MFPGLIGLSMGRTRQNLAYDETINGKKSKEASMFVHNIADKNRDAN